MQGWAWWWCSRKRLSTHKNAMQRMCCITHRENAQCPNPRWTDVIPWRSGWYHAAFETAPTCLHYDKHIWWDVRCEHFFFLHVFARFPGAYRRAPAYVSFFIPSGSKCLECWALMAGCKSARMVPHDHCGTFFAIILEPCTARNVATHKISMFLIPTNFDFVCTLVANGLLRDHSFGPYAQTMSSRRPAAEHFWKSNRKIDKHWQRKP